MKSQGKRINRQINDRRVLFALKRLMKTQKAAAYAVGCSDDMFRYYLTYAKKIPIEIVIQAKAILYQHREKILDFKDLFVEEGLLTTLPLSMHTKLVREELLQAFKTDVPLNAMAQQTQMPIIKRIEEVLEHFFTQKEKNYHAQLSQC